MNYFYLILAIPSIMLLFRFPEKTDIIIQLVIILGLFFVGKKLFKITGCLKIIGLIIIILGIVGYFYLIIRPFLTGEIIPTSVFL